MEYLIIICMLVLLVSQLQAVTVSCEYWSLYGWKTVSDSNAPYGCSLKTVNINEKVTVTGATGGHSSGYGNKNVIGLNIYGPTCRFIPDGLTNVFGDIMYLSVWKSKLESVTSDDFKQFPNLVELWIYENPIEYLEPQVFKNNPKLKGLVLYVNKFKRIGSNFFDELPNLSFCSLSGNGCIDGTAKNAEELNAIIEKSKTNCMEVDENLLIPLTEDERKILANYTKTFEIVLESQEEKRKAINNLKVAIDFINASNTLFDAGERVYRLAIQRFSHMSEDEFARKFLGTLPGPVQISRKRREILSAEECKDLPESMNWVDLGAVANVKDQKECRSCFIFSSTGAIESAVAIEYGISPSKLSIQQTLDCLKNVDNKTERNGCQAGRPEWVWEHAQLESGFVKETPETEYKGTISDQCNKREAASISNVEKWEKISFNQDSVEKVEEQIKCRLAKSGPFHLALTVKKDDVGSFRSGVFTNSDNICKSSEDINHGVLLVGYGEKTLEGKSKTTKYWIIQNSWGERWGDDGYLFIERGKNLCNLATDAFYPTLEKKPKEIEAPSACKETHDVSDSNGKYLKTLCLIEDKKTYEDAQIFCLDKGMRLFRGDSDEVKEAMLSFAIEKWTGKTEFNPFIDGITRNQKPSVPHCTKMDKSDDEFVENNETDCTDKEASVCEFIKKTSLRKPAPKICQKAVNLTGKDGKPLKSLCLVAEDANYEQAVAFCTENAMQLFAVDSQAVQDAFLKAIDSYYADRDYARLWINGKKNDKGEWNTFTPNPKPLYSAASWYGGDSASGECLSILRNKPTEPYGLSGWKCSGNAYVFCEF